MKIILSPSKGKHRLTLEGGDELLFPKETDQVLKGRSLVPPIRSMME